MFFGGKGGVGKTTCASAFALAARRRNTSAHVLIVSTDPAHSLGDVLGVALSNAPRGVARGIEAVELDAPRAFARWVREHRAALGEILDHGTWLDRDDIDALLGLPIPGIDELAGILEIAKAADRTDYDLIVVDTAPTGHTLRLLAAPDTLAGVAAVFEALQAEHRLIRDQLARVGGRLEAADRLVALLAQQAADIAERLRDGRRTTFHWVMLADDLSLAETEDGLAALEAAGIAADDIVVNNVLPDAAACPVCDRRRADERRVLAAIRRRFGRGRTIRVVPAQIREPRGLRALMAIAARDVLTPARTGAARAKARQRASPASMVVSARDAGARGADPMAIAIGAASLIFFGGKGGVGKTTVSAAAAVRLAQADTRRRVLLLSTDPAHSLADVFRAPVADQPRALRGGPRNLAVRELDAARAFAARRRQVEAALDEIASASGAAIQARSTAASELIDLAPPGIDELFGVLSVVDARAAYDVIVVDTAPTGHALRLLEMPDAAREWTQMLLRMLLKYRSLITPGRLAEELVDMSKSIRQLQTMLRDRSQTRFVVVTRAADVPRRETARLLARLRRLGLSAPAVVVNALTLAPGRCARCRAVAAAEARERTALGRLCARRCAIIQTPLAAPAPRGARALAEWSRTWTADA